MNLDKRFPNEPSEYRVAREELLQAEISLRAQVKRLGELRQKLPLGGLIKEDYVFDEMRDGKVAQVRLSELFAPGKDTLIVYSMMFALNQPASGEEVGNRRLPWTFARVHSHRHDRVQGTCVHARHQQQPLVTEPHLAAGRRATPRTIFQRRRNEHRGRSHSLCATRRPGSSVDRLPIWSERLEFLLAHSARHARQDL